jgi:hypothetical protein
MCARTACRPRLRSTTSTFPCPAVRACSAPRVLAGSVRALAKSGPWRRYSGPGQPARSPTFSIDDEIAARCRCSCSRAKLLTLAFDIDADDGVVGGLVLGRNRRELGLDAFPRAVLEQIGIGVHRHARHLLSVAAAGVLVGGANQRNIADDGDEFVADIPVNDNLGIERGCPVLQIARAIPALPVGQMLMKPG